MIIAEGYIYRHKKTGRVYVVTGFCRIEASNKDAVLYRRVNLVKTSTWARPLEEFEDGRFELVCPQNSKSTAHALRTQSVEN